METKKTKKNVEDNLFGSSMKIISLLKKIDALIYKKKTGNAWILSAKLNIAERQVYRYLSLIKKLGAEVQYDYEKKSYCYSNRKRLNIEIGTKKF